MDAKTKKYNEEIEQYNKIVDRDNLEVDSVHDLMVQIKRIGDTLEKIAARLGK